MKAKTTQYGALNLSQYGEAASVLTAPGAADVPPAAQGMQLMCVGSAACETGRFVLAQELRDGRNLNAGFIDNAQAGLKPLTVTLPNGEAVDVGKRDSLLLGALGDRRDRAKDYPLLAARVKKLLARIPVFEDNRFAFGGNGGSAVPPISALDMDLNIGMLMTFLRERMRWLVDLDAADGISDLERKLKTRAVIQAAASRTNVIALLFGTAGSMGNAGAQLLPYLIRHVLNEMRLPNYQVWGFGLGWQAFRGLTPYVEPNFHALMHSLEHLFRYGQQREYINGLTIDMSVAPYERVFLLDDPTLPLDSKTGAVMERALHRFNWRAAQSVRAMLTTNVWPEVMARAVNPDQPNGLTDDGKLRWLNVINIATLAADKPAIGQLAQAMQQRDVLDGVAQRLVA